MNALHQGLSRGGVSNFKTGGKTIVEAVSNKTISAKEVPNSSATEMDISPVKRRVQIPLPKSFEARMQALQARFDLQSNAAVIQMSLGVLHQFIKISGSETQIWIEGEGENRPLSPFVLMGTIGDYNNDKDVTVKYQVMLSPQQDRLLSSMINMLEASSAAEVVRFALRILEGIGKSTGKDEGIFATREGIEIAFDFSCS